MAILKKKNNAEQQDLLQRTDYPDGAIASRFFGTIDKVVKAQNPAVSKYAQRLQDKHSDKTLAEQQKILDKRFMRIATSSGAGTGGVAAIPGIGTIISLAGIAAEAALLLEVCAVYALASAELHGVPTNSEEQRRTIVLLTIAGVGEKDVIAALAQDSTLGSVKSLRSLQLIPRSQLMRANSVLGRIAMRQMRKRFSKAMFRKILPLGVGMVLGAGANRKIAKGMIDHVHTYLGHSPSA